MKKLTCLGLGSELQAIQFLGEEYKNRLLSLGVTNIKVNNIDTFVVSLKLICCNQEENLLQS